MPDDESLKLLERFQTGDSRAADEIFERYVGRLVPLARSRLSPKLARKLDPEDIVQSVFRSFFARAREGRFELRRSGDLWRLLASITVHKVLRKAEYHGAAKRRIKAEESVAEDASSRFPEAIARGPSPADALALTEELELAMQGLRPSHREMLSQRLQGASVEEISNTMRVTERQVRRVLQKVQQWLERRLAETSAESCAAPSKPRRDQ